MKNKSKFGLFLTKLIFRVVVYFIAYLWFFKAVPALWDHGSSIGIELLSVLSLIIVGFIFYFEAVLSELKIDMED